MKTVLQPFGRCRVVGGGADGFDGKRTHVLNVRAGFDVTAVANVICYWTSEYFGKVDQILFEKHDLCMSQIMLYMKKFRKRHENWFNIQSTFKILIMLMWFKFLCQCNKKDRTIQQGYR
jgi:hypothetical protein